MNVDIATLHRAACEKLGLRAETVNLAHQGLEARVHGGQLPATPDSVDGHDATNGEEERT